MQTQHSILDVLFDFLVLSPYVEYLHLHIDIGIHVYISIYNTCKGFWSI